MKLLLLILVGLYFSSLASAMVGCIVTCEWTLPYEVTITEMDEIATVRLLVNEKKTWYNSWRNKTGVVSVLVPGFTESDNAVNMWWYLGSRNEQDEPFHSISSVIYNDLAICSCATSNFIHTACKLEQQAAPRSQVLMPQKSFITWSTWNFLR